MCKIKNIYILARLWMPSMENFIYHRRLVYNMGKIVNIPFTRNPRLFLNAWISLPRPTGRPNLTIRESFLKSLKYCIEKGTIDFECPNGKLDKWLPMAQKRSDWLNSIKFLREARFFNEADFYKTYLN